MIQVSSWIIPIYLLRKEKQSNVKPFHSVSACPQKSGYTSLHWKYLHIDTIPYNYNYFFTCFSLFFFFLLSCLFHFLFYLFLSLINCRIQIFFLYWLLVLGASMPYVPPGLWFGCYQHPPPHLLLVKKMSCGYCSVHSLWCHSPEPYKNPSSIGTSAYKPFPPFLFTSQERK